LSRAPLLAAKKAIESFSSQKDASTAPGISAIREKANFSYLRISRSGGVLLRGAVKSEGTILQKNLKY
jgi:hypothetical protein